MKETRISVNTSNYVDEIIISDTALTIWQDSDLGALSIPLNKDVAEQIIEDLLERFFY